MSTFQFVHHKQETCQLTETFRYCPDRGWKWLQRAAIWVLRRLGCFAMETRIRMVALDAKTILDSIHLERRELELFFNRRAKYLIVGPGDHCDLMRELSVHFPDALGFSNGYGGSQVMGLEVHVVPWIEGHIVLPELEHPISLGV